MKFKDIYWALIILLLASCSTPEDKIKGRTWKGKISRNSDNKELSDVILKISNDTLFLYSNAIFGAANDTLLLVSYNQIDSSYVYKSLTGPDFSFDFNYKIRDTEEVLYLISNDFYITLSKNILDIKSPETINFYTNMIVPRKAYMYLDGAYEGTVEFENQILNMFSLFSLGEVKIKLIFLENYKVKTFGSTFFESGTEIYSYTIKEDRIYLTPKKGQENGEMYTVGFKVVNEGDVLVCQTDRMNIKLVKIY